MIKRIEKKFERLIDFLQHNTNLAEMIINFGGSDEATEMNPEGEYAAIETYLRKIDSEELENYFNS